MKVRAQRKLIWDHWQGVINHEKTVKGLAKALSEIADALPRVEMRSNLFPTERMRAAVSSLCADILKFLTRAHKWCSEGSLKRTIHSFTQPFDLRYSDILEDIRRGSYVVKDLAACGQLFELRQVNKKVDEIGDSVLGISRIESSLGAVITRIDSLETTYIERLEAIAKTTSREFLLQSGPFAIQQIRGADHISQSSHQPHSTPTSSSLTCSSRGSCSHSQTTSCGTHRKR